MKIGNQVRMCIYIYVYSPNRLYQQIVVLCVKIYMDTTSYVGAFQVCIYLKQPFTWFYVDIVRQRKGYTRNNQSYKTTRIYYDTSILKCITSIEKTQNIFIYHVYIWCTDKSTNRQTTMSFTYYFLVYAMFVHAKYIPTISRYICIYMETIYVSYLHINLYIHACIYNMCLVCCNDEHSSFSPYIQKAIFSFAQIYMYRCVGGGRCIPLLAALRTVSSQKKRAHL